MRASFEIFAPQSVPAAFDLTSTMASLAKFSPAFTAVRCGIGDMAGRRAEDTSQALVHMQVGPVVAHMLCNNSSLANLYDQAHWYDVAGIKAIVALRGDSPATNAANSNFGAAPPVLELIDYTKRRTELDVIVAAYPDGHTKSKSPEEDIARLHAKQEAGADAAITQFFFEPETFLRFRDRARAAGISIPLIPGILPGKNWRFVQQISARCGVPISNSLAEKFAKAEQENRSRLMALGHATKLCDTLMAEGVEHFHFFTFNEAKIVSAICHALGFDDEKRFKRVA